MSQLDRTHRQLNCSISSDPGCVRLTCTTTQPPFVDGESTCTAASSDADTNRRGPATCTPRHNNAIRATAALVSGRHHIRCGPANQWARQKCAPHTTGATWTGPNRLAVYVTMLSMLLASVGAVESDSCEPKILNKTPSDPVSALYSLLICVLAAIEQLNPLQVGFGHGAS